MITFAGALLLSSGCDGVAVPATLVQPAGYVVRAQGLNPQATLREVNAHRRVHGLKPLLLDQRLTRPRVSRHGIKRATAGSATVAPAGRGLGTGREALATAQCSLPRTSHLARNLSATRCAAGSRAPSTSATSLCRKRKRPASPSATKRPRLLHPGPRGE